MVTLWEDVLFLKPLVCSQSTCCFFFSLSTCQQQLRAALRTHVLDPLALQEAGGRAVPNIQIGYPHIISFMGNNGCIYMYIFRGGMEGTRSSSTHLRVLVVVSFGTDVVSGTRRGEGDCLG